MMTNLSAPQKPQESGSEIDARYAVLRREYDAAVGNDHAALIAFAAGKGIKATKVSTPLTATARLMVSEDRKNASKYAMVLQLAA